MAFSGEKQQNVAINAARNIVFFEGVNLCYNYKTNQWTRIPAYDGLGVFSINSKNHDFGLVRFSSGSVDLQSQSTTFPDQLVTLTTGATDLNPGGRTIVAGVRPRADGGTWTVRIGTQDNVSDVPTWSTTTSVNSRSGMANFRSEGRYVRMELTNSDGFDTVMAADVEFTPRGRT
jgi:hypothetical protein